MSSTKQEIIELLEHANFRLENAKPYTPEYESALGEVMELEAALDDEQMFEERHFGE